MAMIADRWLPHDFAAEDGDGGFGVGRMRAFAVLTRYCVGGRGGWGVLREAEDEWAWVLGG